MKNIKDENGNLITQNEKVMEKLMQYFIEATEEGQHSINHKEELIEAIEKLKIRNVLGYNEITPEMIKY